MSFRIAMRRNPRRLAFALVGLFSLAWLSGCSEGYSSAIVYELRQDPILKEKPKPPEGFPFAYKADPPGQLPLLSLKEVSDPRNPYSFIKEEDRKNLLLNPTNLRPKDRADLYKTLAAMFGTPARPKVTIPDASGAVDLALIDEMKLDTATLAHGSQLYRLHCLACHGVTGDGRGPSSQWVNPHPRDFRAGLFKFQSVDQTKVTYKLKPTREDLYRTLYQGVEGTAMPAFNLLAPEELDALASYVMHLSIRGETELETFKALNADPKTGELSSEGLPQDLRTVMATFGRDVFGRWQESQKAPIKVEPKKTDAEMKASVQRGQAMFLANVKMLAKVFPKEEFVSKYGKRFGGKGPKDVSDEDYAKSLKAFAGSVSCVTCHGDYGRQVVYDFDEWGTLTKPANLTLNVYRGGRRPVDLYYRIHSGINGSGMLAFGKELNSEQIWDLVNFIQILPYPAMRKTLGVEIH